jgi:diguanylate cyclase (GGDEF)-like protein
MYMLHLHTASRHRHAAAFACILVALLVTPAYALDPKAAFNHYRLDHWGVDEGLPQISVLSITQARLGYLWVGTQNGIARFDGTRFTKYDRKTSGVDTTLAGCALATADGQVWFGTPRGVLNVDGEVVTAIGGSDQLIDVIDLAQTADGNLLAASESGVYTIDRGHLVAMADLRRPAYDLQSDGEDIWIGGLGEITLLHTRIPERMLLPERTLKILHVVRDGGVLWLGTQSGLRRYDLATHTLDAVADAGQGAIESLLLDRDGNLWVGTLERLMRRRPDGRWEMVSSGDLFAHPWIDAMFEDSEGGVWMGSRYESLVRLRDSAITRIGDREGIADPFVWSVLRARDGRLLIGTNDGLVAAGGDGSAHTLIDGKALPQPQVYSLAEDPDGTVWVGTRGGLPLWRDGALTVPPALAPLNGVQINAVQRVGDDDHWIATMDGLYRYQGGVLRSIGPRGGVPAAKVRTILSLSSAVVLVGTEAGVFRVEDEHIERLPGTEALNGSFVPSMAWIRPGLLGITTMDRGLGLLHEGRLLLLGPDAGIPSANGWTLDVIGDYLYVASIDGAYRVALSDLPDPAAKPPYRLRAQVVVEGSQRSGGGRRFGCCNGGGAARTLREGTQLWIASSAGAVRLDTAALPPPAAPPAARIERVYSGEKIYPGNLSVDLDGDHRDLAIQYTGLSLIESDRIEFRYWLDGYDADWSDASTRRTTNYTHLPPGDYRFRVQARPPFGAWGAESAPLAITVVPHWYESSVVRIGATMLALLLLMAVVLRHNAGLRRRARELKHAVDERTMELHAANTQLEQLIRTDSLTGLANRRALDTHKPIAERDWTGAVLLIDIDHFKRVNDEHGHDRGDQVLIALSEVLRATTRDEDRVLRWGGEEFLIVSQNLDMEGALVLAERIRRTFGEWRFRGHDGSPMRVTCSIGIASLPVHAARVGDLDASITLADFAMYRAKREGRDRVYWAALPSEEWTGMFQGDVRESAEQLDELGKLRWRSPAGSVT